MRTTIEVRPDAYAIAKAYAHQHRVSLGEAVSELILSRNSKQPELTISKAGFLQFRANRTLTLEDVQEILDDE